MRFELELHFLSLEPRFLFTAFVKEHSDPGAREGQAKSSR